MLRKEEKLKVPVSAVVVTYNEADRIERCLASLSWAQEIIVIDSLSSDNTVLLCRKYTDKVFQRDWRGYAQQKNAGCSLASFEWVFFIDADEQVSPRLAGEIKEFFAGENPDCDGIVVPRQAFYWGKLIRYGDWAGEKKLRLVKKALARWGEEKSVHEELCMPDKVRQFYSPLYHFTYRNLLHHFKKANRYSWLYARDAFSQRKKVAFFTVFTAPVGRFLNGYIRKQGFRDGIRGLVIASVQSFDVFLRYSKILLLNAGIMRIPHL